jgi:hypothetical protein
MASTLDAATAKLIKLRHFASGAMAVLGTAALTYMAVQQFNGQGFYARELWFLGLLLAVTLEAIATFFRPETSGAKMSIWSLTLMGCSCVFGGFVLRQGLLVGLGLAMVLAGYVVVVFPPLAKKAETDPGQPPSEHPATSDNATR